MKTISAQIVSDLLGVDVTIEVKPLSYIESIEAEAEGQRLFQARYKKKEDDLAIYTYLLAYKDTYCLCQASKVSFVNNNPELEPLNDPNNIDEFLALPAMVIQKWFEVAVRANPFWVTTTDAVTLAMNAFAKNENETSTKD